MFEDSHLPQKPDLQKALDILNYVFCVAFTLEMLLKMIGLGVSKYFASVWNCLDAFIVAVSQNVRFYVVEWFVPIRLTVFSAV